MMKLHSVTAAPAMWPGRLHGKDQKKVARLVMWVFLALGLAGLMWPLTPHPAVAAAATSNTPGGQWQKIEVDPHPPARSGHAMAYDADRERVVLFGGGPIDWAGEGEPLSDTWQWDGEQWQQVDTPTAPPARHGHVMVYEAHLSRVVLFGGQGADGRLLNDLWTFDGQRWQRVHAPGAPSPRVEAAAAYDQLREQTVIFGGRDAQDRTPTDTMLWDGRTWSQRSPVTRPGSRWGHAMAWDPDATRTLLYGGTDGGFPAMRDTWQWDGSVWDRLAEDRETDEPIPHPPRARGVAMAYHAGLAQFILAGGRLVDPEARGFVRTWHFDGERWQRLSDDPGPSARSNAAMAYDSTRHRLILFGGRGREQQFHDTWELRAGE